MNSSPSTDAPAPAGTEGPTGRLVLAQTLLDAALQAQRAGSLPELVLEHPLAARWLCASLQSPRIVVVKHTIDCRRKRRLPGKKGRFFSARELNSCRLPCVVIRAT